MEKSFKMELYERISNCSTPFFVFHLRFAGDLIRFLHSDLKFPMSLLVPLNFSVSSFAPSGMIRRVFGIPDSLQAPVTVFF